MNVVVVGGNGLLGADVVREMQKREWDVYAPSKEDLDICDDKSVTSFFLANSPDWVVNCAAYTDVDGAESNHDRAFLLNAFGAHWLARGSLWVGARFLHLSTDFVFDGRLNRPYTESDKPNPLGIYGKSKLHGEGILVKENEDSIIVRSAWLFGEQRKSFPKTILNAALEGKDLRVVNDQKGSPTYTRDLAIALSNIMESNAPPGIYHIVNTGKTTWYELALECVKAAKIDASIIPISTGDRPTHANRPKNSALDTTKYQTLGYDPLPDWKDAVKRFVGALKEKGLLQIERPG